MCQEVYRAHKRAARGWIVAPTYPLAMEEWRYCHEILKEWIVDSNKSDKRIVLRQGHEIEFKSADNKDENLRGAGLDFAILAEASRIPRDAWEQGIRPALSDRVGRAIFASTPKGRNYFFDLFTIGQDPHQKEYQSWQLPTNTNPLFPKEEWETLRKTLPEMVFKQEFMAEFLEDSSTVFRNIMRCIGGEFAEPEKDHVYVLGVDLAKTFDFTVIFVLDVTTKHFVYFERFNQLDWTLQKKKIYTLAKKYNNALTSIDSTGVGDPIESDLMRAGIRTQGFKFTNISKKELVEFGIIVLEQRWITYPEIPVFLNEMMAFEYEILPTGKVRYQAPDGVHDDCVMAFCLALWPLKSMFYTKAKVDEYEALKDMDHKSADFWYRHHEQKKLMKSRYKMDDDYIFNDQVGMW